MWRNKRAAGCRLAGRLTVTSTVTRTVPSSIVRARGRCMARRRTIRSDAAV